MQFRQNSSFKTVPFCLLFLSGLLFSNICVGQNGFDFNEANNASSGTFSGNLELNANFFMRDSIIGAANTPQYDRQLYGADAWLNLAYSNWGFDFGLRFDMFNNSNLLNPTGSYTDEGIGRWFAQKKIENLGITVGYIYDQVGSGIIFRAYEERPLAIDNALVGIRLTYDLGENWQIKGMTGRQKRQFEVYDPIIKTLSVEGFISMQTTRKKLLTLAPGFGIMNRTLDDVTMESLVATLNTYTPEDAFVPKYNDYAFSAYNTLTFGNLNWYIEGAYKTQGAINNPFGTFVQDSVTLVGNKYVNKPGSVIYSSISYASDGIGITIEGKRTDHFSLRTRPQDQLNRGMISFQPALAKINTYRLTARYNAATQEIGELAFQADIKFSPGENSTLGLNYSNIQNLDGLALYRELYLDYVFKYKRLWTLTAGLQMQSYNQEIYEFKPEVPNVETIIPFTEFLYKIDRKRSFRLELQYMSVGEDTKVFKKQDYGDWAFALVEYSIAPNWTFTASDMYNINPGKNSPENTSGKKKSIHFPRFDIYYTHKSNRFSLSYVKQVEGIVCAGGICRLEPAFSGMKMTVNSSF